jgi:S1-C subfamily serine protease
VHSTETRSRNEWIWVPAILALLLVGLLPSLPGSIFTPAVASPTLSGSSQEPETAPVTATQDKQPSSEALDEQGAAFALEAQIIDVYDGSSPAVVNITNRMYVTYRWMGTVPEEGTGSGFVYDDEGHIVTNYHVIENADELLVTLAGGAVYPAEVVGSDPTNDLAVLSVDANADLPEPLLLGDSGDLRVGQFVVAIGNPFGLEQTLTTGVVSALGRVIESPEDNSFIGEAIQTDAAINPGNSGGPLLDLQGRVIGVNSQIISPSGASSGIGFAVSANTVHRVVPQLIADGYYAHPWLGVDTLPLTSSVVQVLHDAGVDLGSDSGLLVLEAMSDGPANRAGLLGGNRWLRLGRYQLPVSGDIIVAINGHETADLQTLTVYLEMETTIGDTVELTVIRGNDKLTLPVKVAEQP